MKSFEGYLKLKLGDSYILLAGGSHKALSDFLLRNGGQMTGPLTWSGNTALPERSAVDYIVCIDAFADGGTTKWASINTLKTSLGLGSNAYTSTAYLPLSGGTLATNNIWMSPAQLQLMRYDDTVYTDRACIGVTDGNLHIDSYPSHDMYLNFYSGNATVHIGSYTAIHSGNISSQSVNYANSAGTANSLNRISWSASGSTVGDVKAALKASGLPLKNGNWTTVDYWFVGNYGNDSASASGGGIYSVTTIGGYQSNVYNQFLVSCHGDMKLGVIGLTSGNWTQLRWLHYSDEKIANASYADSAGSVSWSNVTSKPFNWSGQSGQPTWLWGSNDGTNYYVWNPSNFSVNYANSAGSASVASGLYYNNDGTLKIWSQSGGGCPECGTETMCIQSLFDGCDPYTDPYGYIPVYPNRCVIALQPKGGYVGVNTIYPSYPLHVEGTCRATSFLSGGTSIFEQNNLWLTPSRVQIGRIDVTAYSDRACVGVTNGNLHIDAYNGYDMYLNFYCPGGIYFASGSYYVSSGNMYMLNYYTTSDRNKKYNISSLSQHIRKFTLKESDKDMYGVIAQEVPEMFRDGKEGEYTVNYNSVLSYYIGCLENKVAELEEKIKELENK